MPLADGVFLQDSSNQEAIRDWTDAAQIPSLDAKQEQEQHSCMKPTVDMWPKYGHPANHSHEVIPSCQVLRLLDSASFLATCKRLAEKEIKEAGPMTDGLWSLGERRVTKGHWTGHHSCYLRESVGVAFCTSNHSWTALGREMYST